MSHASLSRSACLLALLLVAVPAYSAADPAEALIKDYSSIARDLHKAQATQAVLLKQKADLDVRGTDLSKRQDSMNGRTDAHNAEVAQQQRELAKNKSDCSNGNANSSGKANECNNQIKTLNKKTLDVNNGVLPLETEQSALDLQFAQYNQTANDWTVQENQNTTALNSLYRALNDWADRAEGYMGSGPFMDEMQAGHPDPACAHRALPDGLLSIEVLQRYAAGANRCLKSVVAQRKPAGAPATP